MKDPNATTQVMLYGIKVGSAVGVGLVPTAAGVLCLISIVGIPVGIPLLILGAWPLKKVMATRIKRRAAWQHRDQPLDQGAKPWDV